MRGELLNYICCSQKDRWLLKVGQPHFSNKDKADETTGNHSRIMNSRGYYRPLPAKGVEVVASCDQFLVQQLSWERGGGSLHSGYLSCLNLLPLCSLYGPDTHENILKALCLSLKTKRHVIQFARSRIGSCAATHPTNRGPVIMKGEKYDSMAARYHLKLLSSQVWNLFYFKIK